MSAPELTRWLGSRIVWPSTSTLPASIKALTRERDGSATGGANKRSGFSPPWSGATTADVGVGEGYVMNQAGEKLSGPNFSDPRLQRNLAIAAEPAESEAAQL